MADRRFFSPKGPFSLTRLAEICGAEIGGDRDPDAVFTDVAALDTAGPSDISFLDNRRYLPRFRESQAGACIARPEVANQAPSGMALLLTADPYRAYARVAQAFYPAPPPAPVVAPEAIVAADAELGEGCRIDAGAVVGPRARVGRHTWVGANAVIGEAVVLGDEVRIGPGATLVCCLVGDRSIVHAGARIGQDGFGFALGASGHLKIPQLGRVVIEDDVEIGANTTIDRGAGPDTVIGSGTKIDNLVQIGHNVRVGRGCVIVSQAGISGSTVVGDGVMIAGQAGLVGHLHIGDGARIGAQAGVMRDVETGTTVFGAPATVAHEFWRRVAALARLAKETRGK